MTLYIYIKVVIYINSNCGLGSSQQANGPVDQEIPDIRQLETLEIPFVRVEADQQLSELLSEFRSSFPKYI